MLEIDGFFLLFERFCCCALVPAKQEGCLWSHFFHKDQTVLSKVIGVYRKVFSPVSQEPTERDGSKLGAALNCRFRLLSLLHPFAHSGLVLSLWVFTLFQIHPIIKVHWEKTVTENVKAPTKSNSLSCSFFCVFGPYSPSSELSWWKMLIISSQSLETIQLTVSFHLTEIVFHWNPSAIPTHFRHNTSMRCNISEQSSRTYSSKNEEPSYSIIVRADRICLPKQRYPELIEKL